MGKWSRFRTGVFIFTACCAVVNYNYNVFCPAKISLQDVLFLVGKKKKIEILVPYKYLILLVSGRNYCPFRLILQPLNRTYPQKLGEFSCV